MVIADAPPADAHPPTQPPPPRRAVVRRSRGRVVRRLDRNRPLEILAILLLYVVVVNYTLKFASFLLPDDAPPSREESPSLRGSSSSSTTAVWGLSSMRSSMPASSSPSPSRARGGGRRSSLPPHRDYSGMNSRFGICMRSPSSSASSRRGDAVEVARGGSEAEDGIVVSVVDGAADDDDGAGDDRVSAQPTNAPPPSTTTKRKKDDRSRYDRIPVLSYQNDYVIVSKPCGRRCIAIRTRGGVGPGVPSSRPRFAGSWAASRTSFTGLTTARAALACWVSPPRRPRSCTVV
jgi:hypothetical protein